MDQQQAIQPEPKSTPPKQRDFTLWIVLIIIIFACIGTGITYLFLAQPQTTTKTQSGTKTPEDLQKWQKYTNTQHEYSFVYFNIWTLTENQSNADFSLKHLSKTYPGTVEGSFLPSNGRAKSYCEQNREDTNRCSVLKITTNRELFMDRNNYAETGAVSLLIVHPTKGALTITVTRSNFDTPPLMSLILSTLTFADEARIEKLQVCPDSWSTDRKIATINGIAFDAKDIDNTKCNASL